MLFVIAAFAASVLFSDAIFQPEIDIESGERDVLADTNDPQCREFIDRVTAIGNKYQALEPELQAGILGSDRAEIERLIAALESLRSRIADTKPLAAEAELRFENSRSEVNEWFRYILNELHLLQRVGRERLAALPPVETPDAGTVVDHVGEQENDEAEEKEEPKSTKSPEERRDGALLAASEAFEQFRVWHTGGLHPCGKASEGETPWTPTGGAPGEARPADSAPAEVQP